MKAQHKAYRVARLSAFGVSLLIAACLAGGLSLFPEASAKMIGLVAIMSFGTTFLILHVLFVFVLVRELNQLEAAFQKIRRKNYSFVYHMPKNVLHPLNPIRRKVLQYAQSQALEIEQLKQLGQFRREFLADVSHELKTPLFAAQGFIDTLIEDHPQWSREHHSFLQRAARNLTRVNQMLDDLMTTVRMEHGALQMNFVCVDLYQLAQRVGTDFDKLCKQKSIRLRIEPPPAPMEAKADPQYLGQVLSNLIKNAIQHSYKGGKVQVSFHSQGDHIEVQVSDTGRGIPQEALPRIFERFYRVDKSRSHKRGGAGIGLALVKHILEAHNTRPRVVTKPKSGSTFSFRLKRHTPITASASSAK